MNEIDLKVIDLPRQAFGEGFKDHVAPVLYRTHELVTPAKVAIEIASRWGMVAGAPDGEDSSGRQKFRMQETDELADRACRTAQALWMRFERLGWIVGIPDPRLRSADKKETEDA